MLFILIADILVAEVDDKAVITYLSALYKALPTVPPYVRMQNEQVLISFFEIHRKLNVSFSQFREVSKARPSELFCHHFRVFWYRRNLYIVTCLVGSLRRSGPLW